MASPLVSALGKATANIGKMSGALTKLHPGLMLVKGSLDMVGAALDRNAAYLNEGVKINERLAITNQTYAEFSRKNTDALMGNTVGFEKSSKILAEANIMGLEGQGLQRKQLIEAVGRIITGYCALRGAYIDRRNKSAAHRRTGTRRHKEIVVGMKCVYAHRPQRTAAHFCNSNLNLNLLNPRNTRHIDIFDADLLEKVVKLGYMVGLAEQAADNQYFSGLAQTKF